MQLGQDEFRAIVVEHQSMVYSIALRLLAEPPAAEEVAQDVFLELYRALRHIDSTAHLKHWLRRVTVHRSTDYRRRRRLRPEAAAESRTEPWMEEGGGVTATEAGLQGGSAGCQARAGSEAVAARLEQMLQTLPIPMRTAVVLRYQEELSPAEIAALLEQPLATVKSNLQRALVLLRRKAASVLKEYVRA